MTPVAEGTGVRVFVLTVVFLSVALDLPDPVAVVAPVVFVFLRNAVSVGLGSVLVPTTRGSRVILEHTSVAVDVELPLVEA